MSEPLVGPEQAIAALRRADQRWGKALRSFDSFARRLRELGEAADLESRAMTLADLAELKWRSRPGASLATSPFELTADSGRPGPPGLWARFERAMADLGVALEGDSVKALAATFADLSAAALALADACEREATPETRRGVG